MRNNPLILLVISASIAPACNPASDGESDTVTSTDAATTTTIAETENGTATSAGSDATTGAGTDTTTGTGSDATTSAGTDTGADDHGVFPDAEWEYRSPAELGMDPAKLDTFVGYLGGSGVVIKDGYLVKSWGGDTTEIMWASAAKPVLSTMLFFAIDEGRLASVDTPLDELGYWSFQPQDTAMTFRHLADMTGGYARGEGPGQAWAYNDFAIKLYIRTLFERVFDDGSADAATWRSDRLGALQFQDNPGFRAWLGYEDLLYATPRDFARIGWLWLNRGRWGDEHILPQSFFDNHMKPDVANTLPHTSQGGSDYLNIGTYGGESDQTPYGPGIYGFNWWFNDVVEQTGTLTWPDAPPDTFQANGHWNREIVTVIPSLNLVVAAAGAWDLNQNRFSPGDPTWGMNTALALLAEAAGGD